MSSVLQILNKFWPASLRGQVIMGIAMVHLFLMSIFVFDLIGRQRKFLKKQNHDQVNNFVDELAAVSTTYIIANDFDQLERFIMQHANFPNLRYAMILSPDGVVVAHTNKKYIGKKPVDDISLQLVGLTTSKTLLENDRLLDIAAPIFAYNKLVGWARAGVGQEYIQNNMTSTVKNGIVYILIAVLIGILFAILIGNTLTAGLYKLISTSEKIESGERDVRATAFKSRELLNLGTAFNHMLDEIVTNEDLMRKVIETMPVGVWIFNEKGQVISGNSAGKEIWKGLQHVDISDLGIYKAWYTDTNTLIAPEQWAAARALSRGETTIDEEIKIEIFDGSHKIILNSAIPLRGKNGAIIGAIAINVDITERKKIAEKLALSESTFRSAFDHSAIGMALVLPDGKFLRVNRELCKMVGRTEEELLALTFQDITYPEDLEEDMSYLKLTLNGTIDSYQMEKRYFHKDGHLTWVHLNVSLVRDGQANPLFFVSQIEDISERKKSEALLVEEQKRINKAVTDAQEREREEISMELHDNVNQLMAGSSLNIDVVSEMIMKDEKASAVIGKIKGYISEAMEELRRISHKLAPSTHEWISLEEKIRTVVDTMNVGKAIKVRYHFDELQEEIKAEVQLAMYRIIQEQFTNILKHAKASLVVIDVHQSNGDICMSIEDNGVGFDTHITTNGIGLENIKRRVQAFNGSFSIQAIAGKGCKLDIQFPFD